MNELLPSRLCLKKLISHIPVKHVVKKSMISHYKDLDIHLLIGVQQNVLLNINKD